MMAKLTDKDGPAGDAQTDAAGPDAAMPTLTCADYTPRIERLLKSARAEVARARKILDLLASDDK
jgi:hypothetical protein